MWLRKNISGRKKDIQPPDPEEIPYELTAHETKRIDNYYWMKLSDEQKNASIKDEQTTKVLNYLQVENAYLKAMMEHTQPLQEKLYNEMVGRIKQDDESVPYVNNGYWYIPVLRSRKNSCLLSEKGNAAGA